jgi:hypothetical protein
MVAKKLFKNWKNPITELQTCSHYNKFMVTKLDWVAFI